MPIGKTAKNGIIIKSNSGYNYYHGMSDKNGLRELSPSPRGRVKTLKVFDVVEIANNKISIKIYPDGKVVVEPSI